MFELKKNCQKENTKIKMNKKITPIINADDLLEISKFENLILVDVRTGSSAKANYLEKHLKGALFIDLNTQLADIKENVAIGGRHPLPNIEAFSKTIADLGISKDSHVVVYDDKNGANSAARFWWMLRAMDFQKVQVLNGGIQEAEKIGFPLNSGQEFNSKAEVIKNDLWTLPMANINEVEKASNNSDYTIIDVRENNRYLGKHEPIDLIAGHIPNAVNIPFESNLDENGLFLTQEKLKEKYQNLFQTHSSKKIIVHCGSGVTACHTLLALDYAGFKIPKLYVGSWSEWSRNNKKIE